MLAIRSFTRRFTSFLVISTLFFNALSSSPVLAQGKDGIKRQTNADSGRISFIGPESGRFVAAAQALGVSPGGSRPADPALALAKRFAPEFGLTNPGRDLSQVQSHRLDNGRITARYQQNYQGIPVMAGELIVNTNDNGDLYSISGEVSLGLSLPTRPTIDSEQARQTALKATQKWYADTPAEFVVSEPELWVFDESLIAPSIRPPELVWRMEVTAAGNSLPVRELILINAQTGQLSLHFNQIDTAWHVSKTEPVQDAPPTETPETPPVTETPIPDVGATPLPTDALPSTDVASGQSSTGGVVILAATTWYVATTGNDLNSCTSTGSPCATIQGAIDKAASSGDTIRVATGTYIGSNYSVVGITKSIALSGGWNSGYTTQNGMSTIDGQSTRQGVSVSSGTTVTLERFLIQNGSYTSTPAFGGGILNAGTLTLNAVAINNNKATDGGGIYNTGVLTMNNSSVTNNVATYGGGINNTGGQVTLNNSTVSANTSAWSGGGLYNWSSGTININNGTVGNNKATDTSYGDGGGFYIFSGTITLQNTIVAGNTAAHFYPNCNSFISLGYNLIENTTNCNFSATTGDLSNVSAIIGPSVGTPAYQPLSSSSPAVNAGNPAGCTGSTGALATDLRGVARVGACDIGSYEYTAPGATASVAAVGGTPQSTNLSTTFASPLQAIVLDSVGSPKPGVTVTFTAPGSGASGTFADTSTATTTATTNALGVATSASFTANATSGIYLVTASASGAGSSASFQLINAMWYVAPGGNDSNNCLAPATPCATINGAINKAGSGQTVKVAVGTYTDSGTQVVYIDKDLILTGGWNAAFTSQSGLSIIDGENTRRGIYLFGLPGATALIERFSVQNGMDGVSNNGATLTLNDSIIQHSNGVGLWSGGTLTVNNGIISNNTVAGGVQIDGGTATISNTLIRNNISSSYGGGISNAGSLTLNSSSVVNNMSTGQAGGGVINAYLGSMTINNSTISNNSAKDGGGGIINVGTLFLNNTTISSNIATTGGGLNMNAGTATLQNTIIAGNTAGSAPDCSGTVNSSGYNLIGTTSGCTVSGGTNDKLNVNSLLGTYLIGSRPYHVLLAGSPAIDAGNAATCLSTDQRGVSRPQGVKCDIGAYESKSTGASSSFGISVGSDQRIVPLSAPVIPFVVYVVDASGSPVSGVSVTFAAPVSGPSGTFANTGTNTTNVNTNGNGVAIVSNYTANNQLGSYTITATVSGLAGSVSFSVANVAWYVSPTGSNSNSCASSSAPCLTINGAIGKALSGDTIFVEAGTYTGIGSEVVLVDKSVSLSGGWQAGFSTQSGTSIISGQSSRRGITMNSGPTAIDRFKVQNGSASEGSGVLVSNGVTATLNYMTITGNTSSGGGAGIRNYGSLTLNNSTVNGNTAGAPNGTGGGLYNTNTLTINNSTISHNTAGYYVGAIYSQGTLTISNSTVHKNSAPSVGGIYNNPFGGPNVMSIRNSILAGNKASANSNPNCGGTITSLGYNLIGDNSGCVFVSTTGDLVGTDSTPIDPTLMPLQDNGGATFTLALIEGSPAIDAGNPSAPGSGGNACLSTDQRGVIRPVGVRCDIGAYEGSVPYVFIPLLSTYTANNARSLPGIFICDESDVTCSSGDADAQSVHQKAKGTLNLYADKHNRHSIDNNNMPIISTVHYDSGYGNAYWSGTQMIYGDGYGFALADDVVAHELTHGVTDYESGLLYIYQSGAINESFSDLWGEYYDQTNGAGNDDPSVKWLLGEDVTDLGAIRSMNNPPAFGDPDKMTSPQYYKGEADNSGVHINSGVNNKAISLMVDGGAFNGKTVTGIGWDKTAAIYYEVQTNLLGNGANYSDLYYAIQQACTILTGAVPNNITLSDCLNVKNALDAVQMNASVALKHQVTAPLCPAGMVPSTTVFEDQLEGAITDNWNATSRWYLSTDIAKSPTHSLYGQNDAIAGLEEIGMKNGVTIPPNAYLHFGHAYDFDYFGSTYFDGGVLEYSKDNGSTWLDAGALFSAGANYGGSIFSASGNPLGGRKGFVGSTFSYYSYYYTPPNFAPSLVSSRFSLSSLNGQTVKFRFRFGTDSSVAFGGWYIDDVQIYTCVGTPAVPTLLLPANAVLLNTYTPKLDWADSIPPADNYQLQVSTSSSFASTVLDVSNIGNSDYTVSAPLDENTTYYWRVQAFNDENATNGWSLVRNFRTMLLAPELSLPGDGTSPKTLRPTFTWTNPNNNGPAPTGYTIQIATDNLFTKIVHTGNPVGPQYIPTADLPKSSTAPVLYWRVQAKGLNGPSAWSSTRSFIPPANAPLVPTLLAPASNALTTDYTPTLSWSMAAGAVYDHFLVQVDDDQNFGNPEIDIVDNSITLLNYTPGSNLASNTKFYWRMRAVSTGGEMGNWSASRYFRTTLDVPALVTPGNGVSVYEARPMFDWDIVNGATGYTIQIATDNLFTKVVHTGNPTVSQYVPIADLPKNTGSVTLYWRVQSKGANGPSAWSATRSFIPPVNPPPAPTLVAPATNAMTTNYTPTLSWSMPAGSSYELFILQVDDSADFSTPVMDQGVIPLSFSTSTLDPNKTYYWRVRAQNLAGENSNWSLVRSLRTAVAVPTLVAPGNGVMMYELRPIFDWDTVDKATGYTIQIATDSSFAKVVHTGNPVGSQYIPTADLPKSSVAPVLYWRVQAKGLNGSSAWSSTRSFIPPTSPPLVPTLAAPASNALTTDYTPTLSWSMAVGAMYDHFLVQVDDNADFSSPEVNITDGSITTLSYSPASALASNTKFYWRVRAVSAGGEMGNWSTSRFFRTALDVPILISPNNSSSPSSFWPVFNWDDVVGAKGYNIQVSINDTFTQIVTNANTVSSVYQPLSGYCSGIQLYWRVRATGLNGPGGWSPVYSFVTPACP